MNDATDEILQVRREGAVAVMTMNNPRRLNAFNLAMRKAMWERLIEIENDDGVRAIVLTGAGGNLSAGGDISEMKQRPLLEGRMRMELGVRIFRLFMTGPKPLVCAVEGNAAGAGVSFAAASDYCVAASDAKFKIAFIKVGLIPDIGGLWSIPRRIGHRKAIELAAFAEGFGADEALRMQLINEVCEPGKALDRAMVAAEKFAANPPIAMALLRTAFNSAADTVDAACTTEINFQSALQNSADFGEAAQSFMEKRPPKFTGR